MSQLIDRRQNAANKSMVNRQRLIRRCKKQIKQAVSNAISTRSITDMNRGEQISLPTRDLLEPSFNQGQGGFVGRVLPGNEQFIAGDRVKRADETAGSSSGDQGSNQGKGEDNFIFELSREEFLELYFEDLELPSLVKKELASLTTYKTIRSGVTSSGIPTNINIVRSMRQAVSRRIAIASRYKRRLACAEEELKQLETAPVLETEKINELKHTIELLHKKINAVPFIDTFDLRYNNRVRIAAPFTQAVMFCVMDVSGSMDELKKDIAKRFFILLYLFLTRNYKKIELVFIRHHTSAKEVTEEEFFYSRETGGTVVSSALELLHKIIAERYPSASWNVYVAQASDGDNWNADSPYCQELLQQKIIPIVQYFSYIEIMPRHHQSLWEAYQVLASQYKNFAMENIEDVSHIYPVFRELFKRKMA